MDDLNILLSLKKDGIEITDSKTKKVFKLRVFLPTGAGFLIFQNLEVFQKAMKGQFDDSTVEFIDKLFECMFKDQHNFMDQQWCHDNIGLADATKIIGCILPDVLEFLKALGMEVTPLQKKPDGSGKNQATGI